EQNAETPVSSSFKIDGTAPTITAAATASPNVNGWYRSDVTVHFTCSDGGGSGLAGACPPDQTLSTEGSSVQSSAKTVSYNAGDTATSNIVTVKLDKTPPTATVNGVTNGAVYSLSSPPTPACASSDNNGGSGIATGATLTITPAGSGVGIHTAKCSGAVD